MKEKEIELSQVEIRYLLSGTIHWQDIVEKEGRTQRNSSGIRKTDEPLYEKPEPLLEKSEVKNRERFELNQILLGSKNDRRTNGFEGKGVLFLMAVVGIITISTWVYFVFTG
ncbi:hypothetical protein [Desulfitobacterium sp. AusDCA]|uniref:hypothetical protein n=1 Tax=Desulfitobacterium sp. AusDCA TaxID=3240383 RepID=UPI003DA6DB2E